MGYRNLRECIRDLEATGQLIRIEQPIDPHLEAAEVQRRVFAAGGPAIYFANVKDCRFPMVSNLFGTMERMRFLFRDSLNMVQRMVHLRSDPIDVLRHPGRYLDIPLALRFTRPKKRRHGAVLGEETSIDQLPQLQCWPDDGGAYVT